MFIALQIPVTDARRFVESETYRLDIPAWSLPRINKDFVRTFGVVRERLKGGLQEWRGEGYYCQAARAIRFQHPIENISLGQSKELVQYCAFRRLLVNCPVPLACTISRLEIGFGFKKKQPFVPLKGKDCLGLIKHKLNQHIRVKIDKSFHSLPIIEAGDQFAKAYLQSTTHYSQRELPELQEWWCEAGSPLLIFEYDIGEDVTELPQFTRYVQSETLTKADIQLSYIQVELNKKRIPIWFLGIPQYSLNLNSTVLRKLRIHLMRFHAERECIKQIFRLVLEQKIKIKRGTPQTELLQEFLLKSTNLLSKESREGIPQSSILDTVKQADEIVDEVNRAELLDLLSNIRRNLFNNVKSFVEKANTPVNEPVYNINVEINNSVLERELVMPNIIHGSTIHGDVNQVVAHTISDSFNKIKQSDAPDELKLKLEELNKAVAEMCKQLPEEKQKEVVQDLKVLTDEATSKTPRKKWYDLSAEGLIEAAKAVGEIATPVITTAKAVLAFLA